MACAPDYATTSELKSYLRIGDTIDDDQLSLALSASSRLIDRSANRQFGIIAAAEQRIYESTFDRKRDLYVVPIDDLSTVTGLVVETSAGIAVDDTAYTLEPVNALSVGRPWTQFATSVSAAEWAVTALWGWASVPTPIKQACLLQASRLFKRREAPFGVAGSVEFGSELRLLSKLDPDVELIVGAYRRWWAVV